MTLGVILMASLCYDSHQLAYRWPRILIGVLLQRRPLHVSVVEAPSLACSFDPQQYTTRLVVTPQV